jgi:lipopolysaccharide transport system ATP-binding protein
VTASVHVERVSKKFCRDLHRSLRYGMHDILREVKWWRRPVEARLRSDEFWAVRDLSFIVQPGEALAVIGDNGAGKSTLLKMLAGLVKPDAGRIELAGRVCVQDMGSGMLPALSARENIFAQGALLGLRESEMQARIERIVAFAGLEDSVETPLAYFSTGMKARLAFAITAHLEPDVLLVDETLAVGDLTFQRRCREYISGYLNRGGTLILVSHAGYLVQSICQRGVVMDHGRLVFAGSATDALDSYIKRAAHQTYGSLGTRPAPVTSPAITGDPVRIESVAVTPLTGDRIQTGAPVRIELAYCALTRCADTRWSFLVYSGDQSLCITGAMLPLPRSLEPGPGVLRCQIPHLPLTNGVYGLRVGIVQGDHHTPLATLGWHDPAFMFHVDNPIAPLHNLRSIGHVLIETQVEWEQAEPDDPAVTVVKGKAGSQR